MTASDEAKKALEDMIPSARFPLDACVWFRESTGEWVLEIEGVINDTSIGFRHPQPGNLPPEDVAALPALHAEIAAKDAALTAAIDALNELARHPEDEGCSMPGNFRDYYRDACNFAKQKVLEIAALKGDTHE